MTLEIIDALRRTLIAGDLDALGALHQPAARQLAAVPITDPDRPICYPEARDNARFIALLIDDLKFCIECIGDRGAFIVLVQAALARGARVHKEIHDRYEARRGDLRACVERALDRNVRHGGTSLLPTMTDPYLFAIDLLVECGINRRRADSLVNGKARAAKFRDSKRAGR